MNTPTQIKGAARSVTRQSQDTEPASLIHPPQFSDDALALKFADQHSEDFRFIAMSSEWRRWDRARWGLEKTLLSYDLARKICREAAAASGDERLKKAVTSANTVANVERMARSDRRHAATLDQFDVNPWLLNTPRGVLDLRTGELREHRREDYQTKITRVGPGGACPRWTAFLQEVTDDDPSLQRFLARIVGYCLTGVVREHAMFFLHGLGGNGKSVFTETIRSIMGDYAIPAPMEMFTRTRFHAHSTDVAGLQGARIVLASETEAGNFLAEAKIKLLTGGDQVSARKMRSDNVSFSPQFKLILSGNRRPHLRSNSEAMRRRFHLVPFDVTIPEHRKDKLLLDALQLEWPGIIQWAVEGCVDWQQRGLAPPERVQHATAEYLAAQDTIGDWMGASILRQPGSKITSDELFGSYRRFVEGRGEEAGNLKDFVADLEAQGLVKKRGSEGWRWHGIQLIENVSKINESEP
jgi:putative DNA primase/helicase